MAPKKSTKTETVAAPVVQAEPETKTPRSKKAAKTEEAPVATPAHEEESQPTEKRRREVSKESLDAAFTALEQRITEEIEKLTAGAKKFKGVKFLRGHKKALAALHADANRLLKFKRPGTKKPVSSGFLKPIRISGEMAAFLGWDPKEAYSRVSVTKNICQYIKDHNLFNQDDKRKIVCDDKLRKLLKYDPAKAPIDAKTGKPADLTYFRLQQYLKFHFIKNEEAAPVAAPAASTKSKK